MINPSSQPAAPAKCPICGREAAGALRPFCSKRCADVDLGRWFSDSYRVPARADPEADDEETG